MYGYKGDKREQIAEVIIRKKYIGSSSNDIGFKLQEDGTYEAIISEFDKNKYNEKWLDSLSQRYARNFGVRQLEEQGFFIESEEMIDGELFIEAVQSF